MADVGTVLHPRNLGGQILGRSMLGIGHAIGQKWVYDQHYGVALAKRFYQNKPPTILDAPRPCSGARSTFPIRARRSASKGIGEPPVAAGCCAVLNALSDALGDNVIRRAPVSPDMILTSLEAGPSGVRDAHGGYLEQMQHEDLEARRRSQVLFESSLTSCVVLTLM